MLIPSDDKPSVTTGNALGFTLFGIIFLLGIMGILVEYTHLFGKPLPPSYEDLDDAAKDKALVKSKNFLGLVLLSFSFSRNLRKTFWTPQRENDYLTIFNGLRVISMGYIILGHVHETLPVLPIQNPDFGDDIIHNFYLVFILGGFYAVDVFFFMSAFLGAYLMIGKFKGKRYPNFLMVYFHRFYRLLPTLALFHIAYITFWSYLGYGPLWQYAADILVKGCEKSWWLNLLFVNNVVRLKENT